METIIKGAWHENFEKLILVKLVDKVSFHLNITSTVKRLQTCILFISNSRNCAYVIYCLNYLVWWPRFLISKQHFHWFLLKYLEFTPNFTTKVTKIWLNFWYQNHSGYEKNWGMMLWIMSGTFKLTQWRIGNCNICLSLHASKRFDQFNKIFLKPTC